jgi:hypothetical protein
MFIVAVIAEKRKIVLHFLPCYNKTHMNQLKKEIVFFHDIAKIVCDFVVRSENNPAIAQHKTTITSSRSILL